MGKISSYSNGNPPQAADIFLIARSGTNRTITYQNLVDAIGSAGVSDGDKGDIVVSGTGATWTIDTGVVTLAKMADMATASLLGRNTAGTGAPEVLSASTVRTLLSLVPGTNVQTQDAELEAIAGLTSAADRLPYFTGSGTAALATFTSYMRTLLDDADAATAQTTLGLAIGTNVQAYHARLGDIAGITYAQGDIFYYNGTNIVKLAAGTNGYFLKTQGAGANPVWAAIAGGGDMLASNNLSDVANQQTALNNVTAVSAATNEYVLTKDTATGNAIWKVAASGGVSDGDKGDITVSSSGTVWTIDAGVVSLSKMADMATASLLGRNTAGTGAPEVLSASTVRTLLSLVPGTNVQTQDAELEAIAGLTSAADRLPYFTGSGTAALATFTSYMRTLLDDADAATAQTTLGLAIGTNVQAYHARLGDIAGITYAQGDLLYYNGTNIVNLGAGTNGYFLKTQGAGANPVWAAIAGGGDLLASNNLSDVANQQTALNNVTAVSAATNEYVLTKDTGTGNAIWKVAASSGVSDGDKGDITVSSSGTVWTIDAGVVSLSKMANMATASFLGRNTAGTGAPEVLSATTARTILNVEDGADVTDATNVNTAGAVMESDYNAHTILYATTDNTPAALTVGEQTVVGRATGGNITALSIDSDLSSVSGSDDTIPSAKATKAALDLKLALAGGTLTGAINLGENAGLELDAASSADGKYSGIVRAGTAGAALAFGDLCYLSVTDSRWELVDADAEATTFGLLGICVLAAAADGNSTAMLLWGIVRADAVFPAFTIGAPVFAGTTAGDVQTTAPSGAADIIRIVGQGYTADELFFCPSPDYFEHA